MASWHAFKNVFGWQAISTWPFSDSRIQCVKAVYDYRYSGNNVVGGFGFAIGWYFNHLYKHKKYQSGNSKRN